MAHTMVLGTSHTHRGLMLLMELEHGTSLAQPPFSVAVLQGGGSVVHVHTTNRGTKDNGDDKHHNATVVPAPPMPLWAPALGGSTVTSRCLIGPSAWRQHQQST